jgi:hypothetical protein
MLVQKKIYEFFDSCPECAEEKEMEEEVGY